MMKTEDAKKVISTLLQADGGCFHCAGTLCRYFINDFPEHKELTEQMYKKEFDVDLKDGRA